MLAVLCALADVPALRLAHELRRRGEVVEIVTAESLSFARRRSQLIADGVVTTNVTLVDGTELTDSLHGVVNRLLAPPVWAWAKAPASERDYATCELNAFVLSWLAALRCPVRNRPTPECLAGPAPHPAAALASAAGAGLVVPSLRHGTFHAPADADPMAAALRDAPLNACTHQVTCLDARAIGEVPADIRDALSRFLIDVGAAEALVGVDFVIDSGRWTYAGITPAPRVDGAAAAVAVAASLAGIFSWAEPVSA